MRTEQKQPRPLSLWTIRWVILGVAVFVPAEQVEAFVHRSAYSADSLLPRFARGITSSLFTSIQGGNEEASSERESVEAVTVAPKKKNKKPQLSRPERKAMERQKKLDQQKSKKRKSKYELHSTAVSQLTGISTADDVIRAIKRAQNLHDRHDLKVVADFLIDECDVGFAYGYRGSLLARLAVAALHFENHQVARRAIDIRKLG
jgi:hypothetical protein